MVVKLKNIIKDDLIIIVALVITAVVYFKLLFYNHISWDDPEMVFKNKAVQTFDIKALFTNHYVGNYIPITMFVHAITWLIFDDNNAGHHLVSILLHLLNGFLVYKFTNKLVTNKWLGNISGLVFLLHPLQIESIGWISELKTILSATFLLFGLISYLNYLETSKQKFYLITILLFGLACLSKPSAVVFPIIILLIDVIKKSITTTTLLNKIPFFILSILFGLLTLKTQSADKFINHAHEFPFTERLGYAGYAIFKYVGNFIFPNTLSVLYPYPQNIVVAMWVGYTIVTIVVASLLFLAIKKRWVYFSLIALCLTNLVLVLQFIPFGEVLYADRYMYLALLFFTMLVFYFLIQLKVQLRIIGYALVIVLPIATFLRLNVWKNSINLYSDILKKFPNSFVALNSLGAEYMFENENQKALEYLNKAIKASPSNYKGFYNRGLLFLKLNKPELAIKSFNQSLTIYTYSKALIGRASAYYSLNDLSKAISDATAALQLDKKNAKAYFILGNCYNELNKLNEAISAYNNSIDLINDEPDFYFKRGIAQGKKQNFDACINDITLCLNFNPNYYEAYYWRGVAKVNLKKSPCEDFKFAAQNNYEPAINALNKYCR